MNIPNWYENKLIKEYGEEIKNEILDGYASKRVMSFRVNTLKSSSIEIETEMKKNNINILKNPLIANSYYFEENEEIFRQIKNSEIYNDGKIYFQSFSSMLPPIVLEARAGEDILDMTAAPGGKTTQIAALTNNMANITATEMNTARFERMKYNIEKQGANVYCLKQDSRQISDYMKFDKILLDAPCSGSGTLNEYTDFDKIFTEQLINRIKNTQDKLLEKAIKISKKDSIIVYSTCSILKEENEEILQKYIDSKMIEILPIEFKEDNMLKTLPTKTKETLCVKPNKFYEGFFVAKLRKI